MPYTSRYRAYGALSQRMKDDSSPELTLARMRTADETKRMMRRLSKENTKQYGRHLGKITHANPCVVFDTILSQIQSYDNLIVPVVEMMKYLTPMSFDVLSYMLLAHLSDPEKTRLKSDGLNVSLWMQSLSSFCGNLYKKYPTIELVGLLQYIANTLKSGQSLQLLVLRDMVTKMAGIDMFEDLSQDQLEATAGGETLRNSVTDILGIAKNTKRSSTRLKVWAPHGRRRHPRTAQRDSTPAVMAPRPAPPPHPVPTRSYPFLPVPARSCPSLRPAQSFPLPPSLILTLPILEPLPASS